MLSDAENAAQSPPGSDWQPIDEALSELARLAESSSSPDAFYRELLARSMRVLAAVAGAVWLRGPSGSLRMACQSGFERVALGDVQVSAGWHGEVLNAALAVEQGFCVPPSIAEAAGALANPTSHLLMVSPFAVDETVFGAIEVFQRSDCPPESVAGGLRFMAALSELAGQFDRRQRLREAREREELWSQLQNFGLRVHRGLDLESVADEIANEGRPIVGCDRLSVFVGDVGSARAVSISGVDVIDRRATSVQRLQRLVSAVLTIGEPLWHPDPGGADAPLPTQLEELLEAYLDHAHARSIGIYPLQAPASHERDMQSPPQLGALVAEGFTTESDPARWPERLAAIARPSILALANAQRFESIPLVSVWRRLRPSGPMRRRRRWPLVAAVGAGGLVLAGVLALVPVPFRIEARGELRPERQAEIFAPNDGIVAEVNVEHASPVAAGQVLAVLRKPELDLEFTRLAGEVQTARKRLAAVQASRLGAPSADDERTARGNQLTGEEEELKELIRSLEQQDRVLHLQREQLTVRSPLGGQVLTWDVKPLLEARPVQRGQVLMTVADLAGKWIVELQIADDQAGHVLEARQRAAAPLPVSFVLATDPRTTYEGTLGRIGMRTQLDPNQHPVVAATVNLEKAQISERRPGATIIAHIDCGRRALGYVWFHGLLDALRARLWF
jgi:multidrug efflux pump subunit AcrA (membrane-fusion protein)